MWCCSAQGPAGGVMRPPAPQSQRRVRLGAVPSGLHCSSRASPHPLAGVEVPVGAVTNLRLVEEVGKRARLSWTGVPGATEYKVVVRNTQGESADGGGTGGPWPAGAEGPRLPPSWQMAQRGQDVSQAARRGWSSVTCGRALPTWCVSQRWQAAGRAALPRSPSASVSPCRVWHREPWYCVFLPLACVHLSPCKPWRHQGGCRAPLGTPR